MPFKLGTVEGSLRSSSTSSSSSSSVFLFGWQLSIWNCCKPFFSLLYNCQLLCFWRLDLNSAAEGFPRPFFPVIVPSRMFTANRYA
jgi:hypothetical protein